MEWINANLIAIVVMVIILTAVIMMVYKNKKGLLARAALYAVSKAEEAWGSDTGRIKFAEVYTYLNKEYPIITFFFTEAQLSDIIETALADMKQILATKAAKEAKAASQES